MNFSKAQIVLFSSIVIVVLAIGYYFFANNKQVSKNDAAIQKKSAHFLDSTPLHDEAYAAAPINITINFDFDLSEGSRITVSKDGAEWTEGLERIENNKTSLQKSLKRGLDDGTYLVGYVACWPDKSCHDGNFSFKIDSTLKSGYVDMTGKSSVTVDMKNIQFASPKILISPNTTVTWINSDQIEHFVNTETHPAHTYYPEQNSRGLAKGQTYSTTFVSSGQYNYHCSAHASSMTASLIVE